MQNTIHQVIQISNLSYHDGADLCFGVNILSLERSLFKMPEPSDFIKNILLTNPLRTFFYHQKDYTSFQE